MTVVQALSQAMELVRAVGKDSTNKAQGFNFRGIDAVVNAVSPALRQVGVVVTPELRSIEHDTVEVGKNRSTMGVCRVVVAYTFHGPDGDTITAVAPGEAMDSGDKAVPKAMSVAYRIALLQALCIPTDDPDPDSHSYERSAAAEPIVPPGESVAAAKHRIVDRLSQEMAEVDAKQAAKAIWESAELKTVEVTISGHQHQWLTPDEVVVLDAVLADRLEVIACGEPR